MENPRRRTATRILLLLGLFLLIVPALLHAYLLSPVIPSSQDLDVPGLAWWVHRLYPWLLIAGTLMTLPRMIAAFRAPETRKRAQVALTGVALIGLNFFTGVKLAAGTTFREPQKKVFRSVGDSKVDPNRLVLGVEVDGVAKAYPLAILALHYRMTDTIGRTPVLVTYSVLGRIARIYDVSAGRKAEHFKLVGVQHNNAVLADDSTGTWWYQATGEAFYGPRTGARLREIPSRQMTLGAWSALHPGTLVLATEAINADLVKNFENFDHARMSEQDRGGHVRRWQDYGWIVGLEDHGAQRAYDWNDLLERRVVNDSVGATPALIALAPDTTNFGAWRRTVDGRLLVFTADSAGRGMRDTTSGSLWDFNGRCIEGPLNGRRLEELPARQEFWTSWRQFHPATSRWQPQ